ncbi:DUF4329 domain-containing protein [uncultured Chryseobacterium sp.]|uniref:DUF4329 domain-containing protein n=1 Tax=uncultured Chryseobacterium sp. TaxID=259322 RepID=UPI0025FEDF32|nr:DUF4329 domain-containing protein [uncultured Chryseobacterium sp.]
MVTHKDKGIATINYNILNLPVNIEVNPGLRSRRITQYIYRADGVKIGKSFYQNGVTNYMMYLDGFQYKYNDNNIAGSELQFVPTSEGYYSFADNSYIYNYTDHLGNVRLSYTDTNKDGIIQPRQYYVEQCDGPYDPSNPPNCISYWKPGEIVEVNNYYPFGLLHNYTATTQNAYQYKYQGQELQETGWYSFKWRNYMPDVGRFFNVDPLSEKYPTWTPYAFSGNRVIDARELEGLEPYVLFNTRENAAANFGQQYNGKSILQKREYAALIYVQVIDGKKYYAYNKPEKGESHGVPQGVSGKAPKGSTPAAWIHTHGNDDYGSAGNYNDQNFSGEDGDKGYSRSLGLDAFLVTPEGSLKYYDLSSGTEKTLRTDMPSDPNNETPRKNNIDPVSDPKPSVGDYRPKLKPFPNIEPIPYDHPKPILDGGLKSIQDINNKREQPALINRTQLPRHL